MIRKQRHVEEDQEYTANVNRDNRHHITWQEKNKKDVRRRVRTTKKEKITYGWIR
jgi:hypothetical protein